MFDGIDQDDLIIAFFPCTRFEARIPLWFRGEAQQIKNWDVFQKLEYSMDLHNELHEYYLLFSMLCYIAEKRKLRMIIENPYTQPHYLTTYFPIRPTVIDKDRTRRGDYYKKPTQYWFFNCKPQNNLIFEPLDYVPTQIIAKVNKKDGEIGRTTLRSMIHPQYANRFIREFILDGEV